MSKITKDLINENSFDFNMLKLAEEAQEVSLAIINYYTKKEPLDNIALEIADVHIRSKTILKMLRLEDQYCYYKRKKESKLKIKQLLGTLGIKLKLNI